MHSFCTFPLHALTYLAEMFFVTFFWWTMEQVHVSSFTQFSALFSNILCYIELKFGIWISCYKLQIKLQCCYFVSIFVGVRLLYELRLFIITLQLMQFSDFFFYILWHIELKFCTWPSFYELQIHSGLHIKFEGRHFASQSYELWTNNIESTVSCSFLVHALRVGWNVRKV